MFERGFEFSREPIDFRFESFLKLTNCLIKSIINSWFMKIKTENLFF